MKRWIGFLFALTAVVATIPAAQAQDGILEAIRADVAATRAAVERIELKLAAGSIPPTLPPVVTELPPPPPATVTVMGKPSCNPGGVQTINGMGTVRDVCTCSPAVVSVRNAIPGSRLIVTKIPGTGQPAVPPGLVSVHEGGRLVGVCGNTCGFDIGLGDRDFTFRSEVACTNLAVQVR